MVKFVGRDKKAKGGHDCEQKVFSGGTDGLSFNECDTEVDDWLLENCGSKFGEHFLAQRLV